MKIERINNSKNLDGTSQLFNKKYTARMRINPMSTTTSQAWFYITYKPQALYYVKCNNINENVQTAYHNTKCVLAVSMP